MLKEEYKNIKVLYVEDDDIARENGVEYLENFFDEIFEANNAIKAMQIYEKFKPQIIITAFCNQEYLLKAIELQLVKYLIKPVNEKDFEEALMLCLNSLKEDSSNIIKFDENPYFDIFNKTFVVKNEIVKLRAKEVLFLEILIKNKNRYVTYEEIESYVWVDSVMTKDALKTLVKNIKIKISKDMIDNLTNVGYKIAI